MDFSDICLTNYSIGNDAYSYIDRVCSLYGKSAAIIAGKTAAQNSAHKIISNCHAVSVTAQIWYGGEANSQNADILSQMPQIRSADMIFAVGGGRASDTAKFTADLLSKPVFVFPTTPSNSACCSKISVLHTPDGSSEPALLKNPPAHCFIDTQLLCETDSSFLKTSIARATALACDTRIMSRYAPLTHKKTIGVALADSCAQTAFKFGFQACIDNKKHADTEPFRETLRAVSATAGLSLNMLLSDNSDCCKFGPAYAFFSTLVSAGADEYHSDGELFALCTLAALLYDGQMHEYECTKRFFEKLDMPIILRDIDVPPKFISVLSQRMSDLTKDCGYTYKATPQTVRRIFQMLMTV